MTLTEYSFVSMMSFVAIFMKVLLLSICHLFSVKNTSKSMYIHKIHQTEFERETMRTDELCKMLHSPHFTVFIFVACIVDDFYRLRIEIDTQNNNEKL